MYGMLRRGWGVGGNCLVRNKGVDQMYRLECGIHGFIATVSISILVVALAMIVLKRLTPYPSTEKI